MEGQIDVCSVTETPVSKKQTPFVYQHGEMRFLFRNIIEATCASHWPSISQGGLAAGYNRVRHTCTSQEEGKVTSVTSVLGSHGNIVSIPLGKGHQGSP